MKRKEIPCGCDQLLQQSVSRDGSSEGTDGSGLVPDLIRPPRSKIICGRDLLGCDAVLTEILQNKNQALNHKKNRL